MSDGQSEFAVAVDRQRGLLAIRIRSRLCQVEAAVGEMTWCEEIDVEHRVGIVGVDKLPVLTMIFHARTDAAPHAFVYLGIDAVSLWTQRGEIDISARLRVLRGEDMVESGIFVEVGVAGVVGAVGEYFREFQHVVGVAALRSVGSVNIAVAVGF